MAAGSDISLICQSGMEALTAIGVEIPFSSSRGMEDFGVGRVSWRVLAMDANPSDCHVICHGLLACSYHLRHTLPCVKPIPTVITSGTSFCCHRQIAVLTAVSVRLWNCSMERNGDIDHQTTDRNRMNSPSSPSKCLRHLRLGCSASKQRSTLVPEWTLVLYLVWQSGTLYEYHV